MKGAVMWENSEVCVAANEEKISEVAILEELSRVLGSSMFARSGRLGRFLRFTVEAALACKGHILKQYLIGTDVYDRKPPYHPSTDSIVRSEARRLSSKLKEYYESAGKDDPVIIHYRLGSYVPAFCTRCDEHNDVTLTDRVLNELFAQALGANSDTPSVVRKLNVQIIFEGTLRVIHPASGSSAQTNFKTVQSVSERKQMRKVVSMI